MKKLTISFCVLAFGLCMSAHLLAQSPALATYPLTADTVAVVTGNITAADQICTDTMCVKDYTGSPAAGDAMRLWRGGLVWPKETEVNYSRYAEYKVKPKPGNSLTVDSVALEIGCYGTRAYFFANISCSGNDSTFSSATHLDTSTAVLFDIRDGLPPTRSYPVNQFIGSGQTFYLRIFPWYGTTGGITKWIVIRNLSIYGTTSPATGVEPAAKGIPTDFALLQNYPNPFNPSTLLTYHVAEDAFVSIKVYDVLGREVASLVNEIKPSGSYTATWDASGFNSGIYFCKMQSGSFVAMKKMVLAK